MYSASVARGEHACRALPCPAPWALPRTHVFLDDARAACRRNGTEARLPAIWCDWRSAALPAAAARAASRQQRGPLRISHAKPCGPLCVSPLAAPPLPPCALRKHVGGDRRHPQHAAPGAPWRPGPSRGEQEGAGQGGRRRFAARLDDVMGRSMGMRADATVPGRFGTLCGCVSSAAMPGSMHAWLSCMHACGPRRTMNCPIARRVA